MRLCPSLGIPAAIGFFDRHGAKRVWGHNLQLAVDGGTLGKVVGLWRHGASGVLHLNVYGSPAIRPLHNV